MFTLFGSKITGKIYKWKSNLLSSFDSFHNNNTQLLQMPSSFEETHKPILPGNPITIEYKKIKIVSDNFDRFGKSQLMITSNVQTEHTISSRPILDNIIYYDKDVAPYNVIGSNKKYHVINNFNHNKYSNPICYYNPGFTHNNTVTITTKFWEVDDPSFVTKAINYFKQILYFTNYVPTPITSYINIADNVIGSAGNLLISLIGNKELSKEQTIEFSGSNTNKPVMVGYYVCLPNVNDINIINEIVNKYYLEDDMLIKKTDNGELIEFNDTYCIMEVSNEVREELHDYEFITNANNLINNIIKHHKESSLEDKGLYQSVIDKKDNIATDNQDCDIKEFIKINKECEDFKTIKKINQMINDPNIPPHMIKSAYNHLSYENKLWFNCFFPSFKL